MKLDADAKTNASQDWPEKRFFIFAGKAQRQKADTGGDTPADGPGRVWVCCRDHSAKPVVEASGFGGAFGLLGAALFCNYGLSAVCGFAVGIVIFHKN